MKEATLDPLFDLQTLDDLVEHAKKVRTPPAHQMAGDGKLFEAVAIRNPERGLAIDVRSLITGAITWRLHPDLYCEIAGIERPELNRRIEAGEIRMEGEVGD